MNSIDKKQLIHDLMALVEKDLQTALAAVKATTAGAVHEESKAEGSKDTRATEASYLARGQAQRVEDLEETLNRLRFMTLPSLLDESPICAGAVVCLEDEHGNQRWHFLVTAGGGYTLCANKISLTTVTPKSPLGRALIEKHEGDEVELTIAKKSQAFDIIEVF